MKRIRSKHTRKSKNEADTLKAAEMRRRSLETFFGQMLHLKMSQGLKNRNNGRETVQYPREKSENELK